MENKFKFTIKELITVVVLLLSMAGTYYKLQSDMDYLKADKAELSRKISELEHKINTYSSLPQQVETVSNKVAENGKMLNVIHDGLIAKGIISPRRN